MQPIPTEEVVATAAPKIAGVLDRQTKRCRDIGPVLQNTGYAMTALGLTAAVGALFGSPLVLGALGIAALGVAAAGCATAVSGLLLHKAGRGMQEYASFMEHPRNRVQQIHDFTEQFRVGNMSRSVQQRFGLNT